MLQRPPGCIFASQESYRRKEKAALAELAELAELAGLAELAELAGLAEPANRRKLSQATLVIDDAAQEEGTASRGAESRFAAPARRNAKPSGFAQGSRTVRRRRRRARLPGRTAGSNAGHGLPRGAGGLGICGDSAARTDAGFCGGPGGPRAGRSGSVTAGHGHVAGGHCALHCR